MAMTKNIRATMNTVSKLFALVNETQKAVTDVRTAATVQESIEAAKAMTNLSRRVDRMCKKFLIDRKMVDGCYTLSGGCEDIFALSIMSNNEMCFNIYNEVIRGANEDEDIEPEEVADNSDICAD